MATQNPFADPNFGVPATESANPFADPDFGKSNTASDIAKSVKVGVERLPGMVTGLADLPFALAAGARPFTKAADVLGEATGFQPGKWADETKFSAGYDTSKAAVDKAWQDGSAGDIALEYLKNPAYTANQVAESVPSMVAGGLAGKALMGVGRVAQVASKAGGIGPAAPGLAERALGKWAAPAAGGIGEGAVTAGQQMQQYQGDDQQKNAVASLGAGLGTAALGVGAGRLANKLGLETSETAIAKIGSGAAKAADEVPMSAKQRILGGMVSEAVLQELPQSAQEQMWQNYADGKPLMEGVARSSIEGAIAGGVMGGAANIRGGRHQSANIEPGQNTQPTPVESGEATQPTMADIAGESINQTGDPATYADLVAAPRQEAVDPFTAWDQQAAERTQAEIAQTERDRAANTLDYSEPDGAPNWDTQAGATSERQPGLDMLREFDTAGMALDDTPPSERIGINPAAGPLSRAAASAVDAQFIASTGRGLQPRTTDLGVGNDSNVIDVQGRIVEDRAIGTQGRISTQGRIGEQPPAGTMAEAASRARTLPAALPAPSNLRDGLDRIRAQRQEAARAQAAQQQAPAAGTTQALPAPASAAVEANGVTASTQLAQQQEPTNGTQASQTQQVSVQPAQAGGPQAGAPTATAGTIPPGGNRGQAAGLNDGAATQNLGTQGTPAAGAQAQAPQGPVARPDGWRKSMLRAAPIARAMGIDPTGKRLAQVLAEIDARDTRTPAPPAPQPAPGPGPIRLGRNNTPLNEGGKPFKTRKAAGDAKKLQPMMRVVTVPGGYALAEKTPAQLAAEERASRRLRNPNTSAPGEPIPAHAFIAAAGGLNRVAAADMGVDGNPRIGNRTLFAGQGRGLSMEQATQMLIQDGYLSEGTSINDALALVKTSLTRPQYNADGIERIAEAEAQARFDDYLAAQEEAAAEGDADPFGMADEFTAEELDDVGYTDADPALQAEVAALIAQAEAIGIDTYAILEDIARTYANATQDQYNAAARDALAQAIARGNQDGGSTAAQAAPAAEPAADQGLGKPPALELASQTPAERLTDSASERFSVGRSLTKAQRRQVLASLVDAYKTKGAQREFKGLDGNGNERYGYIYSPELFEKSDITGAMVRYYVTLPDGRIAHPSELFPDVSASDVERMALEQDAKRRRLEAFENAIKPFYSDFDSANLSAGQGQVVIEKSGRFAVIPERMGAIGQARENGWELASPSGQVSEQSAGTRAVREQQDGLTSYTAEEATQRQEEAEQAAKAEAARQRAADAQAARDEERKRIAQASVRAAAEFELGQDPLDSLTGQGSMFDDAPAQPAPTAASDDEGRERFTISIEMFGDVPYRASKPVDAGSGKVVSSRVITAKTRLTAANAETLGLPKDKGMVYAWRVSVIRRTNGETHAVIEAMATDNGRSPDGEVLAHFKPVDNPESMERIAPAIVKAVMSDWQAAQSQQAPAATAPVAQPITRADVTAAQQQAATLIAERIDAMTAGEVNTIARRFLPTMGVKPTVSKERNKAAVTDFTKVNPIAAADEFGVTLPADVRRALDAEMQGKVVEAGPAVTYINGDRAEYTGNTETISGGLFYEVLFTEGAKNGKTAVTQSAPDGANPGQRGPVEPTGIVTPQISGNPAQFIKIAADSIKALRKVDVDRVLTETPAAFRQEVAAYIRDQRKDLADEVDDVMADIQPKAAAAKPAAAPQPAAPAAPIEDAGEKIGGARKDRWKERGLNLDDLDAMTEAEGAELATKANVWKPDYEALSGASEPVTAALVKTIYDQLAAKPKKNTPDGRRQYVQMMRIVRDVLTEAKGPEAVRNAYLEIRKRAGLNAADPAAKATGRELLFSVYKGRSDPFVLGYTEMSKAKKLVEDGFPAKGEPWKTRLSVGRAEGGPGTTERGIEIYVERSAEVGTPLTREQILGGFYRVTTKDNRTVAFAPTKADAEAAAATVYERDMKGKKDGKPEPVRPNLDELKRENLPQRIDRDVASEDFVRDLGFRGVEFGNWSAQDERQRILNMAYDGLMDLAEIMGVPPKAMSLNGTLGMAFGARGGGRFAAHYEPGKLVINMTKIRGGGSMAHEWAHAMDHYFGELNKADAYTTQARGASGWYTEDQYKGVPRKRMERLGNEWKSVEKMRLDNLRPEMAAAFDEVMRALFSKQVTKAEMVRSQELDLERTEALSAKEQDAEMKAMYANMAENKRKALDELRADPEDRMYDGRGRSEYANQAQALSGKSENGYWTRPTEMFARAFESWVFDRVTAMGARSDYLVHGVEEDRFAGGGYKGNPYPTGEERARINAAFDKLTKTIKTKETDTGNVAMFSRSSAAQADSNARNVATQLLVDGLKAKWTRSPEIIVARNMQDAQIPQAVRDYDLELKSQGATGEARGFIYKGKVYLLSDQLKGPQQIAEVLFHEVLGHYGLRGAFGDSLNSILQQMGTMRRRDVVAKAREYGLFDKDALGGLDKAAASDSQIWAAMSAKDRLSAAEEVLAEMAQTQPTIGFVQRAIAAIRNWLRANVPGFKNLKLTDADIVQAYILPARGYVTRSNETAQQAIDRAMRDAGFSRAPAGDQTQTENFRRWFAGSKVVDADGKPLVVYHGTDSDFSTFDPKKTRDIGMHFGSVEQATKFGNYTMPVYLNIRNPLRMDDVFSRLNGLEEAWNTIHYETDVSSDESEKLLSMAKSSAKKWSDERDVDNTQIKEFKQFWRLAEKVIRRSGFDGIVYRNKVEGDGDSYIAFRPEQVKSAIGNNGNFDPEDDRINFSRSSEAAKAVGDAIKSVTVTNIKQRAGFKLTDYLGIGLQTLGRRQIVDLYGDMLPLAEYNRLVTQMEADKNEGGAEADQLVTRWAKLPDEAKLADLMHDATLAQIDPAKPYVDGDDKARYMTLQGRFNAMSAEAKQVYTDTRDSYQAHHAKVRSAIKERIERSEIKGERKAALLKQMDDEFFKAIKGVYFPLARFGQYAVTVKGPDGKVESVSRAETKAEAEALRNNLLAAFPRDKGFTVGRVMLSKDFIADRDAVGRGFMTELYQVLDKQDMDAVQRAELEDTLGQLYLSSLPDLSWAKHGIHRKGTPGFSQDARRAYAQNMFHGARYLAKLRYSDLMQDELTAMQKHVDDWREVEDFDQNSAQRVVDEMNKRHESLMNPKSNPLSTALTSLGFVFHLGLSPASAMVNLSQTALVAFPIMGAKWGFNKASAALLKASKQAAAGKNDITGSLNADERAAYDEAVRAGTIDVTMAHDLAGIAQGEDAGVMWKIRPVMRYASFLFHHAERFNRQVTFVAAYRLARDAGADHKAAFEQATKATYDGHFDYGAANRPRIMQGNVAKVLLLFKQYGQNMVYTLSRNAYQAIKGTDAEKAEARKALAGLLTAHAMAAGVLGLPMVTTLLAAASMIGGDDDEPWDAKVALQNMLADTFGQKTAEVLAHGLSRLTPWDISGRVGLDKLIFPDVQEGLEGRRLAESAMAAALGPVAGIGVNLLKGMQMMGEGRYAMGLEAMMPAALRGPVKALRYAEEGVQDKSGISILDEVSPAAIAGQALGFSPSAARNAQEGKSAILAHDRALGERRQELLTKIARATMAKDEETKAEAREEIRRFNEKNPGRRINLNHIMASVRGRQKRIDQAQDGVYLPRNRRDALDAGRFAVTD